MMQGDRKIRVAEVVRETLTEALSYGEVKDPRVADNGLITITHVEVTGDLRMAKVYLVVTGGDEKEAIKGLASAAGFLRHMVGEALSTKAVPELRFFLDDQFERGQKMEKLLAEIAAEEKKTE
jgi:ribosome-binding factor A